MACAAWHSFITIRYPLTLPANSLPMSNIFGSLFQHPDSVNNNPSSDNNVPGNSSPGVQTTTSSTETVTEATDLTGTIKQASKDSTVVSSSVDPAKEQGKNALSHMDPRAAQILAHSYEEAKRVKHSFIEPEQLFLSLIKLIFS